MNPAWTGARVFESDWGSSENGLAPSETGTLGGVGVGMLCYTLPSTFPH